MGQVVKSAAQIMAEIADQETAPELTSGRQPRRRRRRPPLPRDENAPELTGSQRRMLDLVVDYWAAQGVSPTRYQIAVRLGVPYGRAVAEVQALVRAGYLTLDPGGPRSIRPVMGRVR